MCFSSGVGKANTDCFRPWVYSSGLLLFWAFEKCKSGASVPKEEHKLHYGHANVTRGISGRAFHEQRLSKNGESWTRKIKASWSITAYNLLFQNPIFDFFIEHKKQLQLCQSVYWWRVRWFAGSSGSLFLRFVGYLIFCGSVWRFRFGSWTSLYSLGGLPALYHWIPHLF